MEGFVICSRAGVTGGGGQPVAKVCSGENGGLPPISVRQTALFPTLLRAEIGWLSPIFASWDLHHGLLGCPPEINSAKIE